MDDLDRSFAFYVGVIGFRVVFDRPQERFAYLDLDGIHLMHEEADGPGRCFRTTPLDPYGRGVKFQIEVADVTATYAQRWRWPTYGRPAEFLIRLPLGSDTCL